MDIPALFNYFSNLVQKNDEDSQSLLSPIVLTALTALGGLGLYLGIQHYQSRKIPNMVVIPSNPEKAPEESPFIEEIAPLIKELDKPENLEKKEKYESVIKAC